MRSSNVRFAIVLTAVALAGGCSASPPEPQTPAAHEPGAAPSATVRDLSGAEVPLSSMWKHGKALLVFYRGRW